MINKKRKKEILKIAILKLNFLIFFLNHQKIATKTLKTLINSVFHFGFMSFKSSYNIMLSIIFGITW